MAKILVVRFSALGDVAMTVPVLYSFARRYPQHQLVVLSRPHMACLFENAPANLTFREADLKGKYKGFKGLLRLSGELRKESFDALADLHDVLRSKVIDWGFRLCGIPVAVINKGRKEKKQLTAARHKRLVPLRKSIQRYVDVFNKLGFEFPLTFQSLFEDVPADVSFAEEDFSDKTIKYVGIAPFAAHPGKIYPLDKMEEVIASLAKVPDVRVLLFGGGKREKDLLETWQSRYSGVFSLAGKYRLGQELAIMSKLSVMVAMDSGNMHLASLVRVPVVSIWGATHPYAGFMPWGEERTTVIQTDLPCRPCSIFGNKPCWRKDYACMCYIDPQKIVEEVVRITHFS